MPSHTGVARAGELHFQLSRTQITIVILGDYVTEVHAFLRHLSTLTLSHPLLTIKMCGMIRIRSEVRRARPPL